MNRMSKCAFNKTDTNKGTNILQLWEAYFDMSLIDQKYLGRWYNIRFIPPGSKLFSCKLGLKLFWVSDPGVLYKLHLKNIHKLHFTNIAQKAAHPTTSGEIYATDFINHYLTICIFLFKIKIYIYLSLVYRISSTFSPLQNSLPLFRAQYTK